MPGSRRGLGELIAERCDGVGPARAGERVEPDEQLAVAIVARENVDDPRDPVDFLWAVACGDHSRRRPR